MIFDESSYFKNENDSSFMISNDSSVSFGEFENDSDNYRFF
jgi:hypothetical protein